MASGWWDNYGAISGCVAAYAPIYAASLAASYSNLANAGTYDAQVGTAPTWASGTGWTFNGSTQILKCDYQPKSADGTAFSMIARFSGATNSGGLFGVRYTSTAKLAIQPNNSAVSYWAMAQTNVGTAITSGVVAITQSTAGTGAGYRDGSSDTTGIATSANSARTLAIGAISISNAGATTGEVFYAGNIQAVAVFSSVLSSGEVSTLTTLMNALDGSGDPNASTGQPTSKRFQGVPFMGRGAQRVVRGSF